MLKVIEVNITRTDKCLYDDIKIGMLKHIMPLFISAYLVRTGINGVDEKLLTDGEYFNIDPICRDEYNRVVRPLIRELVNRIQFVYKRNPSTKIKVFNSIWYINAVYGKIKYIITIN